MKSEVVRRSEPVKFVSDRERAGRIQGNNNSFREIVASKGNFNALDGTTHSSEAVANLASERFLDGREGDLTAMPAEGGLFKGVDGKDYSTEAEARVASETHLVSQPRRSPKTK